MCEDGWMDGELRESFSIGVEVRQGCVVSPWQFNIHKDV